MLLHFSLEPHDHRVPYVRGQHRLALQSGEFQPLVHLFFSRPHTLRSPTASRYGHTHFAGAHTWCTCFAYMPGIQAWCTHLVYMLCVHAWCTCFVYMPTHSIYCTKDQTAQVSCFIHLESLSKLIQPAQHKSHCRQHKNEQTGCVPRKLCPCNVNHMKFSHD